MKSLPPWMNKKAEAKEPKKEERREAKMPPGKRMKVEKKEAMKKGRC